MNPNGTIAANKVAPKMMNDVVPPYAGALPSFARPQPQPQAEVHVQTPQAQVPTNEMPSIITNSDSPSFPVTAPQESIPATQGPVNPMFSSAAPSIATAVTSPEPAAPAPMADANLTAPIIAQPIAPVTHAPKQKTNWLAITVAVIIAAALGAVAYLAFKQSH